MLISMAMLSQSMAMAYNCFAVSITTSIYHCIPLVNVLFTGAPLTLLTYMIMTM